MPNENKFNALDVLEGLIQSAEAQFGEHHFDGTRLKADGLHYCTVCHTPRQYKLEAALGDSVDSRLVPVACACQRAEMDKEKDAERSEERRRMINEIRQTGLPSAAYYTSTFAVDDSPTSKVSIICRNYVKNWYKAKYQNVGMILNGGVGTGKTFYACCIANALIDVGISVAITSTSEVLRRGFDNEKAAYIRRIVQNDLLIIDDLGSERNTPYGLEWLYNMIDERDKIGLPLIVTTNLSVTQMQNEIYISYKRIFDRLLGMCKVQVRCEGESRRGLTDAKQDKVIRNIIFGG